MAAFGVGGESDMLKVVGVRFKPVDRIYYFDPRDYKIKLHEYVLAESWRGLERGQVVQGISYYAEDELPLPLKPILRLSGPEDEKVISKNKAQAKRDLKVCQEIARAHKLPMKFVGAEYLFDRSRLMFYFTAEGRIDFRELLRSLAGSLRTRIELRQISAREEAKILGGLGPCGRVFCCHSFLSEFNIVSIKTARDQGIFFNPVKTTGLCGRLMCCLKYEEDLYESSVSTTENLMFIKK
ncbi:MAG: hypothetical protein RLZ12_806 [Bacillota bacterium]|jgi:cell fate regulator YaaT (PSP1 superfamily)